MSAYLIYNRAHRLLSLHYKAQISKFSKAAHLLVHNFVKFNGAGQYDVNTIYDRRSALIAKCSDLQDLGLVSHDHTAIFSLLSILN